MIRFERDLARLELLLSGRSELSATEAAWDEAEQIAKRIASRGGFVMLPIAAKVEFTGRH